MPEAKDHQEPGVERPDPAGAPIPHFSRHGRLDRRLRMELGDQLCALILEARLMPTTMRDIHANSRLVHMWRGMSRDMYSLMWHVVGSMTLVTQLRRYVARYRHG